MGKRDRAGQRGGPRNRLVIARGTVALAGLLAIGLVPQDGQPSARRTLLRRSSWAAQASTRCTPTTPAGSSTSSRRSSATTHSASLSTSGANHSARNRSVRARGPVTALVDGTVVGANPRVISLGAHDVVQLDVGAVVPFRTYTFAASL
jgi:hypothetical protein